MLIIDQGTVLDRIDYNCEQVSVTVEEGRKAGAYTRPLLSSTGAVSATQSTP